MYNWQEQQIIAMQMAAVMRMHQAQQQQQQQQLQFGYVPPQNTIALESEESDEDDEESRTLFVANLDDRITEELLYECFVQAGPIESVRIPKDNTGKKRSFGFITYVHSCSTPYAHELFQGLTLFRKTLTIKLQGNAQVQPQRRSLPIGVGNASSASGSSNSRAHDVEPLKRRSYDNSSLRGSNYPAYYDVSMNDTSGGSGGGSGGGRNPFKHNTSSDWTRGTSTGNRSNVKERISRVPSKAHSPVEKPRHDADHNRRRGDRRSEQRNRHRR